MRVTSNSFADEKVLEADQVLEVRNVSGRLYVARKERHTRTNGTARSRPTTRMGPASTKRT
jgi:hypothetical protein